MININWSTLLFQIMNFGIMVFVLSRVFFKPVIRILDQRSEQVTKSLQEAQERERKAAEAQAHYEQTLADAQEQVLVLQQQAQEELLQTKQQVLTEAKAQVQSMRETAEQDLDQARQQAVAEHRRELGNLAVDLSSRLIRQSGGVAFQEATLQEFLDRLDRLTPENYRQDLPADDTSLLRVQVVSAQALDERQRTALETRTAKLLEREIEVRYRVDAGLIAGATMRFGGTVIDGSLSGQLQNLNERYLSNEEREAA
jgi:F-type H+-transporting ATPase subunit b